VSQVVKSVNGRKIHFDGAHFRHDIAAKAF